jgi:hypothetical protein
VLYRNQPSGWVAKVPAIEGCYAIMPARQTGSHERWVHEDGRSTTIPIHGGQEIGPPLFYRILNQLGITASDLERLR